MIRKTWVNGLLFFESARLSYIALFRWLSPPTYIASKILMPLNQLIFFTLLGIYATSRDNSSFYVIGNAMQITAVNGIFGVTMTIGDDRFSGTLPYLFGVPSNRLLMYLGRAVFHILDGATGVVISLILGTLLFGIDLSHANPFLLLLAIAVTTVSTAGLGLALGSLSLVTVNAIFFGNLIYFLLLAFCGVNIPLENMPEWVQVISNFLPITHGLEAAREIVKGSGFGEVSSLLAWELVIGMAYILLGYSFFRWIEFQARRRGTLDTM
jgi:ABC-2 type transport system permease protein